MNRRAFIACLGCGGASALAGCGMLRRKEEAPMAIDATDWDISVCGLNCARCKMLEQEKCAGCRGPLDQHWSPGCKFLPCARARGHRYCFQCDAFPCDKLQAFAADGHEHHRLAVENLKQMQALGLEKWVASQPKPMFCPGWRF
ncbi:MAG: DUF3795 domain-containing protein [Planctomycetota bacterium]